jgi:hypothetical protein
MTSMFRATEMKTSGWWGESEISAAWLSRGD